MTNHYNVTVALSLSSNLLIAQLQQSAADNSSGNNTDNRQKWKLLQSWKRGQQSNVISVTIENMAASCKYMQSNGCWGGGWGGGEVGLLCKCTVRFLWVPKGTGCKRGFNSVLEKAYIKAVRTHVHNLLEQPLRSAVMLQACCNLWHGFQLAQQHAPVVYLVIL